jgi:hypothetical protein
MKDVLLNYSLLAHTAKATLYHQGYVCMQQDSHGSGKS